MPSWQTDVSHPCDTIYDTLMEQGKQYLLTVSIASIAGGLCCTAFVDRLHRRHFLTWSFLLLMVLFIITGGVYYGVAHTSGAPATVICVAICHFFFNFGKKDPRRLPGRKMQIDGRTLIDFPFTGANTLTFIIPAEIFPTCYRCTCHGISAAAGKLGSMIAVLVVFGINEAYQSETRQGLIFLIFSIFMAFGAVYSWAYLPNIQRRVANPYEAGRGTAKLEAKNLEDLGEGRERAKMDGEVVTIQEKVEMVRRRR